MHKFPEFALATQSETSPQCSVIIPAYQGKHVIGACVAAVAKAAEGFNAEILVVESSGDGTRELLAEHYPEVTVLTSPLRLSAGQARNRGIHQSRGHWLFCVDQDCVVPPDWISRHLKHLSKPGVGAAGGSIAVANSRSLSGWCVYFLEFLNHFPSRSAQLRTDNFLIGANCSWHREVFQSLSFPDQTLGEDLLLSRAVSSLGYGVIYDPTITVLHCNRQGWREFRRYCRAMGKAAGEDQQKISGQRIQLLQRWPLLSYGIPFIILPLIGWRLLKAPRGYLARFIFLLPACAAGQFIWTESFRRTLVARQ